MSKRDGVLLLCDEVLAPIAAPCVGDADRVLRRLENRTTVSRLLVQYLRLRQRPRRDPQLLCLNLVSAARRICTHPVGERLAPPDEDSAAVQVEQELAGRSRDDEAGVRTPVRRVTHIARPAADNRRDSCQGIFVTYTYTVVPIMAIDPIAVRRVLTSSSVCDAVNGASTTALAPAPSRSALSCVNTWR